MACYFNTNIIEDTKHVLESFPHSELYINYCILKEKGLRKDALTILNKYIENIITLNTETKLKLSLIIIKLCDKYLNSVNFSIDKDFIPYPLGSKLILTTFLHSLDTTNHLIYYYIAIYFSGDGNYTKFFKPEETKIYFLLQSLRVKPDFQLGLLALIDYQFEILWYSSHHLNESIYIGDEKKDYEVLNYITELIDQISDNDIKANLLNNFSYYKNQLDDWMTFKHSSYDDFVKYCEDNKREYFYPTAIYYDEK